MFSNESTENLLANLEDELTEAIELRNPKKGESNIAIEIEEKMTPPIPTTRTFAETLSKPTPPVPTARKLQSLDKNEKNDENEIIQLSSISSSSASENHKNVSQSTIIKASGRKANSANNKVLMVHETEGLPSEETFFIVKHGKWAQDEMTETAPKRTETPSSSARSFDLTPHVEVVTQKSQSHTSSSATQTSQESTSESSSPEECLKLKKTSKKRSKEKVKKKSKSKTSSEDLQTTISSTKEDRTRVEIKQAIGIQIHSTGPMKFLKSLKSPRIKVSLYNEDSGKQIGSTVLSKVGIFDDDFNNLHCVWNELLLIEEDLKRLREIHNNALLFFEMINSDDKNICWAFMTLFSPQSCNIEDKFQLQFFEYQNPKRSWFTRKERNVSDLNIFDQWSKSSRTKFHGTIHVTIKALNQRQESVNQKATGGDERKISVDSMNRRWQKLPGQACKIPNKIFQKINFHDKGSMNVKFSQDGSLIALTEVTKDGSIVHIHKFPEMREVFTMLEHSDLIHDIDWLKPRKNFEESQWMLSSSSDFTAIVWKLEEDCYNYHILPHPSFVYAGKFLQCDDTSKILIVTAGRDSIVRIWQSRKKFDGFELIQEMKHPNYNKSAYITSIATRNIETFYTGSSSGEIVEWTLNGDGDFHMNREFALDDIKGKIITSLELHPRGNKIFLRIRDFKSNDVSGTIFVLGVPTGLITQKYHQIEMPNESHGKLRVTSCGTHLFASNGHLIRYYSIQNGCLAAPVDKNYLEIRIPPCDKISSMDYHPKDFFFVVAVYGRNGGIIVSCFESESSEVDLFEKLKIESSLKSLPKKSTSTQFSDIIKKLDEVFLAPFDSDLSNRQESSSKPNNNTFTIENERSKTYSVSQGPATYTIQKNQNNTYEIQRKNGSDDEDDTTISESLN